MQDQGTIHIGMAIRWARLHRGMTCAAVADKMGCNRSWLYRVESGSYSPAYDFVERAASLFGFEVEDMRCGSIADLIKSLSASQQQALRRKVDKLSLGNTDVWSQVSKGTRLPSLTVLRAMAAQLKLTIDELVYGDTRRGTEE